MIRSKKKSVVEEMRAYNDFRLSQKLLASLRFEYAKPALRALLEQRAATLANVELQKRKESESRKEISQEELEKRAILSLAEAKGREKEAPEEFWDRSILSLHESKARRKTTEEERAERASFLTAEAESREKAFGSQEERVRKELGEHAYLLFDEHRSREKTFQEEHVERANLSFLEEEGMQAVLRSRPIQLIDEVATEARGELRLMALTVRNEALKRSRRTNFQKMFSAFWYKGNLPSLQKLDFEINRFSTSLKGLLELVSGSDGIEFRTMGFNARLKQYGKEYKPYAWAREFERPLWMDSAEKRYRMMQHFSRYGRTFEVEECLAGYQIYASFRGFATTEDISRIITEDRYNHPKYLNEFAKFINNRDFSDRKELLLGISPVQYSPENKYKKFDPDIPIFIGMDFEAMVHFFMFHYITKNDEERSAVLTLYLKRRLGKIAGDNEKYKSFCKEIVEMLYERPLISKEMLAVISADADFHPIRDIKIHVHFFRKFVNFFYKLAGRKPRYTEISRSLLRKIERRSMISLHRRDFSCLMEDAKKGNEKSERNELVNQGKIDKTYDNANTKEDYTNDNDKELSHAPNMPDREFFEQNVDYEKTYLNESALANHNGDTLEDLARRAPMEHFWPRKLNKDKDKENVKTNLNWDKQFFNWRKEEHQNPSIVQTAEIESCSNFDTPRYSASKEGSKSTLVPSFREAIHWVEADGKQKNHAPASLSRASNASKEPFLPSETGSLFRVVGPSLSKRETPIPQGDKSAPAPQGSKSAPAPQGGKSAPAPQGGKSAPAPQGGKSAPTPQGGKSAPTPQGGKSAPNLVDIDHNDSSIVEDFGGLPMPSDGAVTPLVPLSIPDGIAAVLTKANSVHSVTDSTKKTESSSSTEQSIEQSNGSKTPFFKSTVQTGSDSETNFRGKMLVYKADGGYSVLHRREPSDHISEKGNSGKSPNAFRVSNNPQSFYKNFEHLKELCKNPREIEVRPSENRFESNSIV